MPHPLPSQSIFSGALVTMTESSPGAGPAHVPLSQRSAEELLQRADELRLMAKTATSHEVMVALETLAGRYTDLAERRLCESRRSR